MDESTITFIGMTVTFLMSASGLAWQVYKERRKLPGESRATNGQAAESYAHAAEITGKENITLKERLTKAEERIDALEKEVREVKSLNFDLDEHNERLSHQVISLGGTPVPFIRRTATDQ